MPEIDVQKLEALLQQVLAVLEPMQSKSAGLIETPRRLARAYIDLLTPQEFQFTSFEEKKYDELIVVRDIPFVSLCEHHVLPFMGTAAIGYIPNGRIAGLSKLARAVEYHARRLQVQERMTVEIADMIEKNLSPRGIGVMLQARHSCMEIRGVQKSGVVTTTSALRGALRNDAAARAEFLKLSTGASSVGPAI